MLYFDVEADWQNFNRIKNEIDKLKTALLDVNLNDAQVGEMTQKLDVLTKEFESMARAATIAGDDLQKSFFERLENAQKTFAGDDVDKIENAYTTLKDGIRNAFAQLDEAGDKSIETFKKLESEIAKYKKTAGEAFMRGDDKTADALNAKVKALEAVLKENKRNLDEIENTANALTKYESELDKSYEKAINNANAHATIRTQMRKLREEMQQMAASGKTNTAEYAEMQEKLGDLSKAYRSVSKQMQVFGNENANLQGVISGLSGLAGAVSVGQGAIGMFAGESENLAKVLTKVQSIMAVTNGLQTVSNTLNENSAFRLKTLTKIQDLWSLGIKKTGTALVKMGASANVARVAAIGLQSALTLGIGAAIAAAVALISKLVSKWQEAKEAQEAFNKEVASNAAKPVAAIQRLSTEFERLDLEGRERFVKDNAKAFEELGVAVNSVADAENLLIKNKEAFINAQMSKAMAAAALKMAQDKAEDYVKKSMQLEQAKAEGFTVTEEMYKNWQRQANMFVKNSAEAEVARKAKKLLKEYNVGDWAYSTGGEKRKVKKLEDEREKIEEEIKKFYQSSEEYRQAAEDQLKQIGANTDLVVEKSVDWYNQKIADLRKNLGKLKDTTGKEAEAINKQIEEYQTEIDKILNKQKTEKPTQGKDPIAEQMASAKNDYAAAAAMMASTNDVTAKYGQELYDKLKEQGEDYLAFLIRLRDNSVNLTDSQRIMIETAIADLTKPQQQKQQENPLDKALSEYKTFATARAELDAKYQQDYFLLAAAGRTEELKELEKAYNKAIVDMKQKYGQLDTSLISNIMSDVSSQTREDLEKNLANARKLMAYLRAADKTKVPKPEGIDENYLAQMKPEDIKDIVEQMEKMQEAYINSKHYPFDGIVKGLKMMTEAEDLYRKAEEAAAEGNEELANSYRQSAQEMKHGAMEQFQRAISNSLTTVGQLAQGMQTLAEATNNTNFAKFASGLSDAVDIAQSAVSGAMTGGVWGALASVVMNIGSKAINSNAETAQKEADRRTAAIEFQTRYNKLLSERNYLESDYQGILGNDKLGRAQAAWGEAQKSLEAYNAAVGKSMGDVELQSRNYTTSFLNPLEGIETKATEVLGKVFGQDNVEAVEKLGAKVANTLTFGLFDLGKDKSNYNDSVKSAMERGLNDLQAMQIQTGERKWYKIGSRDKYESLYDIAPELWGGDVNGEFDAEAAKELLATNKDLTDEQRKQIENVIGLKEQYDEAMKVVEDMAKEVVGNISDGMTDAIVNAVENGADTWSDFQASGANAIKALGKQMVQSLIYQNYMKKYEEDIKKAIGKGDNDGLMKTIGEIGNRMPEMYAAGQELLKAVYEKGEQLGYEMYNTESGQQSAVAGAFQTMSEDTAGVLEARFTAVYESNLAMQGILNSIGGNIGKLTDIAVGNYQINNDIRNIVVDSNLHLQTIAENSIKIEKLCTTISADLYDVNQNTKKL